jgi:predicted hydrocarbon binding protein
MGLGKLTLKEETSKRWKFTGDRLIEHKPNSDRPTCHYVRGYLCGAINSLKSVKAAAVEASCQSMGDTHCEFILQVIGISNK